MLKIKNSKLNENLQPARLLAILLKFNKILPFYLLECRKICVTVYIFRKN